MKFIGYAFLTCLSLGIIGAIAGVGIFAWALNHYGNDLPDYKALETYEPDVVTRVYTGQGNLMAEFSTEKRIFVPIEFIPDTIKQAFIAAEDKKFYAHKGIDYVGIVRAMINNIKNPTNLQGASTITQQVAKNFLLTNERSYERKIKEAILATRMERAMSKDRLLELYLNQIYLGVGTYGVAAASQQYFGKSLDNLTIAEAAYLAALPKAPNNYHPTRKKQRAINRRNWVIGRMAIDGYITEEEKDAEQLSPLGNIDLDESTTSYSAPYFAEEIRRFLRDEYGQDGLYTQGMIVRSSLDPELQTIATKAFRDGLVNYDIGQGYRGPVASFDNFDNWKDRLGSIPTQKGMAPSWKLALYFGDLEIRFDDGEIGKLSQGGVQWAGDQLQKGAIIMVQVDDKEDDLYRIRQVPKVEGAFIVMNPHTGRVLAMQGGWDYQNSEFNRATQAKRQPGSSFKPFIYLSALEEGLTPATIILDAPVAFEQGPGLPLWKPQNYSDKFYGPTTLRLGIEKSRNVMTVRLADYIGMERISRTAKKFSIYDRMTTNLSASLGSNETTLINMTSAYGMFVNGGKKIQPKFIDRVQDRYGKTLYDNDDRSCVHCGPKIRWNENLTVPKIADSRETVTSPQHAYQITSILEGAVQRGTGVRLKNLPFPVAGKTGTTNDSKDAWFVGFTPNLVFGVYVGYDQPKSLGRKATGSSIAIPIVKSFLENAYDDGLINPTPFRIPSGISMMQVDAKTGRRSIPGITKNTIWESFIKGQNIDNQQTIVGGNTVISFDAPDMNYDTMYQQLNDNRINEPIIENNKNENPALQGTGGLY
jgi:penicillin-binding protein 1A